jgi:hypothetical protein
VRDLRQPLCADDRVSNNNLQKPGKTCINLLGFFGLLQAGVPLASEIVGLVGGRFRVSSGAKVDGIGERASAGLRILDFGPKGQSHISPGQRPEVPQIEQSPALKGPNLQCDGPRGAVFSRLAVVASVKIRQHPKSQVLHAGRRHPRRASEGVRVNRPV